LLRVVLPQQPARAFVGAFVHSFREADWSRYHTGDEWP
jgi:hypothetical protein